MEDGTFVWLMVSLDPVHHDREDTAQVLTLHLGGPNTTKRVLTFEGFKWDQRLYWELRPAMLGIF